jgi:hypothetical protein
VSALPFFLCLQAMDEQPDLVDHALLQLLSNFMSKVTVMYQGFPMCRDLLCLQAMDEQPDLVDDALLQLLSHLMSKVAVMYQCFPMCGDLSCVCRLWMSSRIWLATLSCKCFQSPCLRLL